MSGRLLYCIVAPDHAPPRVGGVDDSPVEAVACEGLSVWVSPAASPPSPTLERIRRHHEVVQSAAEGDATPLPVRFGQWIERPDALGDWLRPRAEGFERLLEELAGSLEFGVRAVDPAAAEAHRPRAGGGREYMEALLERERSRRAREALGQEVLEALRSELEGVVRREAVEPPTSPETILTVAHAVARRDFGMYRSRVERLRPRWPALRLLISGPWPPYSFVE